MDSRFSERSGARLISIVVACVIIFFVCAPFSSQAGKSLEVKAGITHDTSPGGPLIPQTPLTTLSAFHEQTLDGYKSTILKSVSDSAAAHHYNASPSAPMPQAPANDPDFSTARIRPANETGSTPVDLGSRNFNWSLPIVSLPGRAGLDLDLTVFYNSLVWTKQGTTTKFGLNRGFPGYNGVNRAAGFELHLPYLHQRYQNQDYGGWAYLLVTPSGGRVELRQIGTSNVYESADGTYTQLTDNGTSGATMRTTDGTLYTFGFNEMGTGPFGQPVVKGRRCTEIKDRNGNFISATHNANGAITSITDTLGRVLNFNYDTTTNTLSSITQTRNGGTFTYVTFTYGIVAFSVNFLPTDTANNMNGASTQVLTQINLPDGTYHRFDYNTYAQVYRITKYAADGHALNYTNYNLPLDNSVQQSDCPRFTERRDWAEYGVMNTSQEVLTTYSVASDGSWSQKIAPDGTVSKEFFHTTGWQTGLTYLTEVWSSGVRKKWTSTAWTQDDTGLSYQKNPRVYDSITEDAEGNRRHIDITYGVGYSLPTEIREYSADGSGYGGFIRRTYIAYNLAQAYIDRRIIGLVESLHVVDQNNNYVKKITYDYDRGGEYLVGASAAATRHDATNYGAGFVTGRANQTDVWRWDVTDINNATKALRQKHTGYNINGSVVFSRDALNHQTTFNYADSFSDGNNGRNTFAFPTTVTDGDNFSSTVQYNYDFSAVTRTQDPKGAVQTTTYDSFDRVSQMTNTVNNAYTRWVFPASMNYVQQFSTLQDGAGEAYSIDYLDGWGRLRTSWSDHPGSAGGYTAVVLMYDQMGRVVQQSNPTEVNGSGVPAGDDASGWVWNYQTYDWSGRPLITTNPDGSTRENLYAGCGCAGGDATTVKDEKGRRRRLTRDLLGRLKQVDELAWNQTVYATTTFTHNGRDQVTGVSQSGQSRTLVYDGYGRLQSRTTPEQGTATFSYFADDSVQTVTDARGAASTYSYNNRHLISAITYGVPGGVAATPNVSFAYDSAGNRTNMTDGSGSVDYVYNTLSRLTSETRNFSGVGSFSLSYAYNLAGELTSVTNPWNAVVSYPYDKTGRVTSVNGANYFGVSNYANSITYRAFDSVKTMNYANGRTLSAAYDSRMRPSTWNVANVLGYNYNYDYFSERTGRVSYAGSILDSSLDRSYEYDHVGRLVVSHSGAEARAHAYSGQWGTMDGPFSQGYEYDVWGNLTHKYGWGGEVQGGGAGQSSDIYYNYTGNRRNGFSYDAAGNLTNDLGQTFTYDATGQQATASYGGYLLQQTYNGDGLRVKKVENGTTTLYLRSTVLGGKVVAELNSSGGWMRGYVYLGSNLLAVQQGGVYWMHEDPVTKSKRVTNGAGAIVSTIETDPWGADTNRSNNAAFQPRKFTTYDRDLNGTDEAMFRRYNRWHSRFDQPDPYEGSYDNTNPQSFNRYAFVLNDPVNFTDPSGLCTFNISITGANNISKDALAAMQSEISRIFGQAGQGINFGPATAGPTYHVNIGNISATVLPTALGSTRVNPDGSISSYGAAYPNRVSASLANGDSISRAMGTHPTNFGTAMGRVVAHETGHYLLQLSNAQHTSGGLMRAQFKGDQNLFRQGGDFDRAFQFSVLQRLALNKLCEPVTTDMTVPDTTPAMRPLIPLSRGTSGISRMGMNDAGRGIRVGGVGPLSWLYWLYGGDRLGRGSLDYVGPFR